MVLFDCRPFRWSQSPSWFQTPGHQAKAGTAPGRSVVLQLARKAHSRRVSPALCRPRASARQAPRPAGNVTPTPRRRLNPGRQPKIRGCGCGQACARSRVGVDLACSRSLAFAQRTLRRLQPVRARIWSTAPGERRRPPATRASAGRLVSLPTHRERRTVPGTPYTPIIIFDYVIPHTCYNIRHVCIHVRVL